MTTLAVLAPFGIHDFVDYRGKPANAMDCNNQGRHGGGGSLGS